MAIKGKNVHDNYILPGVFATAVDYLADRRNGGAAVEGDAYYNTTDNVLMTYNGSVWSPAGMSGIGPGSLDAVVNIGSKVTIDGTLTAGVEIEATDGYIGTDGQLLLLDNDDTGSDVHCLEITDAGTAASIQITSAQASDDIQGTSDTWAITSAGVITGTALTLGDDNAITMGGSSDAVLQWDQSRLALSAAADSVLRIGAAAYTYDVEFIGNTAVTNLMKWDLDGGADSVGALVFDNADLDLGDGDLIRLGDSNDFTLGVTAGSPNNLILTGSGERLTIGADDEGMDVYWYTEATGDYVFFDESNSLVDFIDVNLDLDDDSLLRFGTSNDMTIQYIGASDVLRILGDNLRLDFGATGAGFDMYWMTEDAGNYIFWDEDNSRMDMVDVDLRLDDDARLYFGSDADAYLAWDNTNSTIDVVGNIAITGTLAISGALNIGNISMDDDEELRFGASNDFVLHYDTSAGNLLIDAAAANDIVDFGSSVATDLILHGASASTDVHWDSSENTLGFLDSAVLAFGNTAASPDIEMSWDTTRLNITGSGEEIRIGSSGEGMQVIFYGETAGADMYWAEAADMLLLTGGAAISLNDDVEILFGTGTSNAGDFKMYADDTDLFIQEVSAAGKNLKLGESGKGLHVIFYGDTAGADLEWVQASNMLEFQDDAILAFGDASDVTITWDQSDLLIEPATQGVGIIKVGATAGIDFNFYGDTNTKIASFDSGAAALILDDYDLTLGDSDILTFGDSDDFTIVHDGATTVLLIDGGAADTAIGIGKTNNLDIVIYGDTTTDAVTFDTSAELATLNGFDLQISDDDILQFGDAGTTDCYITWDQTQLQIVPSSNVFIGDKTNYVSISSAGAMTQTGTANFTCNSAAANMGGLILPHHATSSPSGAGGEGAVWFETDASKLWVNIGGTNWIGTVLS